MVDSTTSLREVLEKIAKENEFSNCNVEIKPISSGGANYTSQLYLATISDDIKQLKLFAKVIIMGEKIRSQGFDSFFDIEPFVYTELSKIYQQLEEKHKVPEQHRYKFPKYYGHNSTRGHEILVFEDLTAQNYSLYDRFKSVNWAYAFEATAELAKLHALSFTFEKEQPKEFERVLNILLNPFKYNEDIKGLLARFIEKTLSASEGKNKCRFQDFITKVDVMHDFIEYQRPLQHTVLTHGDFRVSNQLYKVDDEGRYHLKILDYQTMKAGSPVADLLFFIVTGTDEEFRAKHYFTLVDHYYSQLSLAMRRLGLKPNEIYSRDDFDTELKMKLPYALVVAASVLPLVMVEEEDAPVMDREKDFTTFKIDKNGKLFPERINGILNDFIKWKVL